MGWVGVATIIWASYAAILGYAFGTKFEDDHTKAFVLAFGAALAVTVAIELVRFVKKKLTSKATQETAV
jgi:membrane protein DedA with SNARE-associated domain